MRHQQAWVVDGAHLSCWVELSSLGKSWTLADLGDRCRGRVELNPNKVSDRTLALMQMFEPDHLTRADVAIDYLDVPIGDYVFRRDRVKTTTYQTPSGVEGLMLGGRNSERYVRIYDKARELGRDDLECTRVEGVGKARQVLAPNLLEGVEAVRAEIPEGLSYADAAGVALLLRFPDVARRYDRRTVRRLRGVVRELGGSLRSPDGIYREFRDRLVDEASAVSEGERVRRAAVYS